MPTKVSGSYFPQDRFLATQPGSFGVGQNTAAIGIFGLKRGWRAGFVRPCSNTLSKFRQTCT
jgi:hypothetical protein